MQPEKWLSLTWGYDQRGRAFGCSLGKVDEAGSMRLNTFDRGRDPSLPGYPIPSAPHTPAWGYGAMGLWDTGMTCNL